MVSGASRQLHLVNVLAKLFLRQFGEKHAVLRDVVVELLLGHVGQVLHGGRTGGAGLSAGGAAGSAAGASCSASSRRALGPWLRGGKVLSRGGLARSRASDGPRGRPRSAGVVAEAGVRQSPSDWPNAVGAATLTMGEVTSLSSGAGTDRSRAMRTLTTARPRDLRTTTPRPGCLGRSVWRTDIAVSRN